jgi:hypothetical protein
MEREPWRNVVRGQKRPVEGQFDRARRRQNPPYPRVEGGRSLEELKHQLERRWVDGGRFHREEEEPRYRQGNGDDHQAWQQGPMLNRPRDLKGREGGANPNPNPNPNLGHGGRGGGGRRGEEERQSNDDMYTMLARWPFLE